jgi:Asp-tRNA(Asn)/Glu-tRNA(Gln) amidotransferase B subunit
MVDNQDEESEYEMDPEFAKLMAEGQSEVSRHDSDDNVSVMSFATNNQDKYFVEPDADLDEIMDKLMQQKSKHVRALEAKQNEWTSQMVKATREEVEILVGDDKLLKFQQELADIRKDVTMGGKVILKQETPKLSFADDVLIKKFEEEATLKKEVTKKVTQVEEI